MQSANQLRRQELRLWKNRIGRACQSGHLHHSTGRLSSGPLLQSTRPIDASSAGLSSRARETVLEDEVAAEVDAVVRPVLHQVRAFDGGGDRRKGFDYGEDVNTPADFIHIEELQIIHRRTETVRGKLSC